MKAETRTDLRARARARAGTRIYIFLQLQSFRVAPMKSYYDSDFVPSANRIAKHAVVNGRLAPLNRSRP